MVLDRALADAEVGGDVLAGMAGEHQSMTWRWRGVRPAIALAAVSRQADSFADRRRCSIARSMLASSSSRPIGFSMKSAAPAFIAWTAIGTSPWPVIMIAGSRVPLALEPLQQLKPAHAGHPGIDQQAAFAAGTIGLRGMPRR